jgi:hypothetical protein
VKSPESYGTAQPYRRDGFPFRDQSFDLGPRKTDASFGDQSHRPDRDPRRKADGDVDRLAVQVIDAAGVQPPGVVPVQGDAIALTRNLPLARKRSDAHARQRRRTRGRQVGMRGAHARRATNQRSGVSHGVQRHVLSRTTRLGSTVVAHGAVAPPLSLRRIK